MKTSTAFRLIAVLLAAISACLLLSCSGGETVEETQAQSVETQENYTDLTEINLTQDWVLVYSDKDEIALDAVRHLRTAIKEIYGLELSMKTDYLAKNEQPSPREILVGPTNREASGTLMADLRAKDYAYSVVNGGVIAIVGGSKDAIMQSVKSFLNDLFGYTESGTGAKSVINVGTEMIYKEPYPVTALTIEGNPISDYTIVYYEDNDNNPATDRFKDQADRIGARIAELSGCELPIVCYPAKVSTAYTISVGSEKARNEDCSYCVTAYLGNVKVSAGCNHIDEATDALLNSLLPPTLTGEVNIDSLDEESLYGYYFTSSSHWSELTLQSTENITSVCPGVTSYKNTYLDRNGNPTTAYFVEALPGSVSFVHGTKDGASSAGAFQTPTTQVPRLHAVAEMQSKGSDVVAMVNGGLFDMSNPAYCHGLYIKNGVILSQQDTNWMHFPIFAVMKDGSYFIGLPTEVNISDIKECVPGRFAPLEDDFISASEFGLKWSDSLSTRRHARTAVGLKADGTIVLCVVDSDNERTNGATLGDLAMIMQEMGCSSVINLDGGGSSVIYTRDDSVSDFTVIEAFHRLNNPLGGEWVRPVVDSVLLVRNPDYKEI